MPARERTTAFGQVFKGQGDKLAGGSEDYGGVELSGWAILRTADPYGTQVTGEGSVLLAAGEDVDFKAHVYG